MIVGALPDTAAVGNNGLAPPVPKALVSRRGIAQASKSVDEAEFGGESRVRVSWRDKEE